MFDIAPSELLIVALVAIVLIGPKDLPRVMRVVGQWVGKGRAMSRHFRGAIDEMIREAELEEMEKKWKAENERIMREHADLMSSVTAPLPVAGLPAPAGEAGAPVEPSAHPEIAPPERGFGEVPEVSAPAHDPAATASAAPATTRHEA